MERNAFVAVAISIAILLVYYELILPRFYPPPSRQAQQAAKVDEPEPLPVQESGAPAAEAVATEGAEEAPVANAPQFTVDTDLYHAEFTAAGGRLRSFTLKQFPTTTEKDSPPLEMVRPGAGGVLPLGLELRGKETVKDAGVLYEIEGPRELKLSGEQEGSVTLTWRQPGVLVEKRFHFRGDRYPFVVDVVPRETPPANVEIGLSWVKGIPPAEDHTKTRVFQGVLALVNNKVVTKTFTDLEKGEVMTGSIGWAGYGSTYFLSAVAPQNADNLRLWLRFQEHTAEARFLERTAGDAALPFEFYVGPKQMSALEDAGHNLQKAIDLGYFAFIAVPMLQALRFLHYVTGNWGVAIVLLTVGIKVVFIPLTQKSFQSMREMQKLQPQMAKLRERLKDNPEQMNREIMELYRRHKVNPLSGCLPMILQIPVFVGLYSALSNAIELRHAPFFLWINDLSSPDRLGSVQLPYVDSPGIPVLTIIMGATMLIQQWMTPAAGDPAQQRMMMFMPLIFTVMFINFPSGLVLYWLVNNMLTIAQQYVMVRRNTDR